MQFRLFPIVLFALAACGTKSSSNPKLPDNTPSVILVSIDSLRADHTTPYGYQAKFSGEPTTPFMAKLASEGVLWENASSAAPWTLPSHISIMTGMSVLQHKVRTRGFRLADNTGHIAGKFQEAGYRTAGFYSAPFLHPSWGYYQGFDTYIGAAKYLNSEKTTKAITSLDGGLMQDVHNSADTDKETAEQVVDRAIEWLESENNAKEPFFMFLHLWDPHYDYEPPQKYADMFHPGYEGKLNGAGFYKSERELSESELQHIISLYDAEIRYTDDHLARFWKKLEELGLANNIIFALTSDHGDEFWEHGQKGHHKSLFKEVLHVPMILRAPGLVPAGLKISGTAPNYDLAPTLLDIAKLPPWTDRDGISLRPQWENPTQDFPSIADLMHPGRKKFLHSWRSGTDKVLFSYKPKPMQLMVYDLSEDPSELGPRFLASESDSPFAPSAMAAFTKAIQGGPRPANMDESATMTAQLAELGYADSDPSLDENER
ncbi:MAG TPA: sulfatase [Planctomycetota bacterium]|nr:hypothetical protein [Planctomycetota bacterium]MDP6128863.1 sulfatase [Planctomycetota bacterium]HJM38562.1 sulfatase [Planctomycetota bacterium]|tara:strand:- start:5131 stop:6594 length:1464 start_codon:yes stop_codon:yes gene_type:complete